MEPRTFVTRSRRSLHHAGGESLRRAVDSERVGWGDSTQAAVMAKNS